MKSIEMLRLLALVRCNILKPTPPGLPNPPPPLSGGETGEELSFPPDKGGLRGGGLRRFMRYMAMTVLLCGASAAQAVDYVSVSEGSAILYDAPSTQAKKLFVVNRYMPFEQIVTLDNWVKVRDRSGGLYWVEKRVLSGKRYVYALLPLLDVRTAPDFSAARAFQVRQQIALEHLESTGTGWIKVRHLDGSVGYVRSTEVWGG